MAAAPSPTPPGEERDDCRLGKRHPTIAYVEITWLGRNCFRLKGREGTVITDPCPPESGYRVGKQPADIVTLSRKDDERYNALTVLGGEPRVLDAPGEYEVGGILVTAIATKLPDAGRNIIFVIELDGIRVAHLGLLTASPPASVLEGLKDVGVLLLPVGGGGSLQARMAQDVMTTIDPRIAIPMNYKTEMEKLELDPLEKFLAETGSKAEPQPKLTISRSQLPQDLTIMVLQPRP
jgi:L-ascorbate metabolism protein UlaG (beta-lactamase superfamily)